MSGQLMEINGFWSGLFALAMIGGPILGAALSAMLCLYDRDN